MDKLAAYYGTGRTSSRLAFNFTFISAPLRGPGHAGHRGGDRGGAAARGAWPAWTGSNHDMFRFPTRWAEDDPGRVRVALLMLLTPARHAGALPGRRDRAGRHRREPGPVRDPLGVLYWPAYAGRDAMRTPMPWTDGPGGGFTRPGVGRGCPLGDLGACNVADQRDDPDSMLTLVVDVLALRRDTPALRGGSYRSLEGPGALWAWSRGDEMVVAANMGPDPVALDGVVGRVRIGTDRGRDGEAVAGTLRLAGWEAAVVERRT